MHDVDINAVKNDFSVSPELINDVKSFTQCLLIFIKRFYFWFNQISRFEKLLFDEGLITIAHVKALELQINTKSGFNMVARYCFENTPQSINVLAAFRNLQEHKIVVMKDIKHDKEHKIFDIYISKKMLLWLKNNYMLPKLYASNYQTLINHHN